MKRHLWWVDSCRIFGHHWKVTNLALAADSEHLVRSEKCSRCGVRRRTCIACNPHPSSP